MFNAGFFGKNPPKWWVGQVPLGQTTNKLDPRKWGDRVQVRISGYHPKEGSVLPNKDLPWAIILKPTSQGNLNKGSTAICGGEWVIGVFLDDKCEHPAIVGVLGRSDYSYTVGVGDQESQQSTNYENTNIYNERNYASSWNRKSGNDGTPSGQQEPLQISQNFYNMNNPINPIA